jgi:hypothetical protein
MGAAFVGMGAMVLVLLAYVWVTVTIRVLRGRRSPDLWSYGGHPIRQAARRSRLASLICVGLIAFGLLLRHFYG